MTEPAEHVSILRWLRGEAGTAVILFAISALAVYVIASERFQQHSVDFELQTKETLERVETKLATFAVQGDVSKLEARINVLETRERDGLTVLTRLEAQIERLHKDVNDLETIRGLLVQLLNRSDVTSSGYSSGNLPVPMP